jgi:chromosome segregation ATPase
VTTNIFSKYSPEAIEHAKSHGHEFCFRPNSTSTWCAVAGKYDFDHPKKTKTERLAEADAKIEVLERDLIAAQKGGAEAAERAGRAERRAQSLEQELASARFEATSMGNVICRRDAQIRVLQGDLQRKTQLAEDFRNEIDGVRAEAAEAKSESRQWREAWERLVSDPDVAKIQDVRSTLQANHIYVGDVGARSILEGLRGKKWGV